MEAKRLARAAWRLLECAQRMAEKADAKIGGFAIRNRIEEIQIHTEGYAEPGYDGDVVATGDWNSVDRYDSRLQVRVDLLGGDLPERLCEAFERIGVEIEWSDEWSTCEDCGKLVRTSGDSYSWQPAYVIMNDCELFCHECAQGFAEEYLQSIEGEPDRCCALDDVDPEDYGYVKHNAESFETGWHPGQNDDPHKLAKELRSYGIERFLFKLDENSQFYSRWSVYIHEDETDKLPESEDSDEE